MSRMKVFAIILALAISTTFAQEQWVARYGMDGSDRVYASDLLAGGGYISTGRTTSFSPFSFEDAFLLKVEPTGDTAWWKIFELDERDERAYALDVTSDEGFIIAGFAEARDTTDADFYLAKADSGGSLEWTKTYGGEGQDTACSVIETADGGFLVCGYSTSFTYGGGVCWVLKTDSLGDTLWSGLYGAGADEAFSSVIPAHDEGYILAGWSTPAEGGRDVYLVKIDEDGNEVFSKIYGGEYDDMAYSIEPTSDSGYIVIGNTWSYAAGENDIWLLKVDSLGDTLWTRTYGGANNEEGFGLAQTADGGFILVGCTRSWGLGQEDVWLIRTDENGDTLWSQLYGGEKLDQCYDVYQTADDGFFMAGRTRSFGSVRCDYYLIKTDEAGTVQVAEPEPGEEPVELFLVTPARLSRPLAISYQLSLPGRVKLTAYDLAGRQVRELVDTHQSPGSYAITWDGTDDAGSALTPGVYFIRLEACGSYRAARMVVLN